MAMRGLRDLDKASAWRRSIAAQAESGKSVRSWCRLHDVKEASFYWWRRELARRDTLSSSSDPSQPSLPTRPAKLSPPRSQRTEPAPSARSSSRPEVPPRQRVQPASFVPVHVTDDGAVGGLPDPFDRSIEPRIEIMLTNGRCVRIVGAVDRQVVADVLSALMPDVVRGEAIYDDEPDRVSHRRVPSC